MAPTVLIIDNDDSFTYNLVQTLARLSCSARVRPHHALHIDEVQQYRHIIFSPGPGTPDDYPAMHRVLAAFGGSKRILGVCLGHQAIAQHYGAQLVNLPTVYHGRRRRIDILAPDEPLFAGLSSSTPVGLYHSWAVVPASIPDCLRVTSVSEDGIIMSLAHTRHDVRGVQFHPESIITDCGMHMLANWLGV